MLGIVTNDIMEKAFVATINLALVDKLKNDLSLKGFVFSTIPYALFNAKTKGISLTLYESGKLVIQGKDKDDFILYYIEPEILQAFSYSHPYAQSDMTARIGVDEAGKGDFFGPLCIASFFGNEESIQELINWGIKDSKKLVDAQIEVLASKVKTFPHEVISIFPSKYNELYEKFQNLNTLLGWGHATAIENLVEKTGCKKVIIDQFAKEHVVESALRRKKLDIELTQKHKGESDIVVAAASILARDAFVKGMRRLEEKWNFSLPKGASKQVVAAGKKFCELYGKDNLPLVAKMHFRTLEELQ